MNGKKMDAQQECIDLQYEIDEAPQKVWRAITMPEFRQSWLPDADLADSEATTLTPGHAVTCKMRDNAPPFLESTVTFHVVPNAAGGTSLRIIQVPDDQRLAQPKKAAANTNMCLMRAA
jgi:uncharacterized protein YndB with AHSA1/START domain